MDRPPAADGSYDPTLKVSGSPSGTPPPRPDIAAAPASDRFGKFVRVEKLGAGGMGEVWKAWDDGLQRWVALKFLKGGDAEEIARFTREARTAGRLNHPNIAAIFETGEAQGRPFIAMQLIGGTTLKAFPRGDRKALVKLVRDAATAVHYAHQQGVIHRDLKPENLMVASHHLYVMDFGLARPAEGASDLSVSGLVVGTPAYMPPEQARGERADARSDVYSLGATLYELLTDRKPHSGKNALETLRQLQDEEAKPPRKIDPSIDADLETVVLKCLEKDRDRRYGSALELADDLGRWLEGEAVRARPPSLVYRIRKGAAKRKAILGVATAGVAAVVVSLAILLPTWIAERKAREALQELGPLWSRVVTAREWTRQPFRKPAEIRAEFEELERLLSAFVERQAGVAQGWYVRARERMFRGDLEGARRDLDAAVRIAPAFGPAWSLLGQNRLQQYQLFVYDAPMNRELLTDKTRETLQGALEALKRGRTDGAGEEAKRWGLSRTPEDDVSWVLAAALHEYFVEEREQDAVERLRRAQEQRPSEDYCRQLGILSRDPKEKIRWLDLAVAIAPHQAAGRYDRGMARAAEGDYAGAVEDLSRAIEIHPGMAFAYYGRGVARRKTGDLDGALDDYTRAIELAPDLLNAYNNRGTLRQARGDLAGAIQDFTRAIDLVPNATVLLYNRGLVRFAAADAAGAVDDFAQVIRLLPEFGPAWCDRGRARQALGDLEGALSDYSRAVELSPGYWKASFNRGLLRAARNDDAGAAVDFATVIRIKPDFAPAWSEQAALRSSGGDASGAIRDYTRAIELDPRYPEPLAGRAIVRMNSGDPAAARADFQKALDVAPPDWSQRKAVETALAKLRQDLER